MTDQTNVSTESLVKDNLSILRQFEKTNRSNFNAKNPIYINIEEPEQENRIFTISNGILKNNVGKTFPKSIIKPIKQIQFKVQVNPQTNQDIIKAQSSSTEANVVFFKETDLQQPSQTELTICNIAFALKFMIQQGIFDSNDIQIMLKQMWKLAAHYASKSKNKPAKTSVILLGQNEMAPILLLQNDFNIEQPLNQKFFEDLDKLIQTGQLPQDLEQNSDKQMMDKLKQETNTFRSQKFQQLENLLLQQQVEQSPSDHIFEFINQNFNLTIDQLAEIKKMKESLDKGDYKQNICRILDTILFFKLNQIESTQHMTQLQKQELLDQDLLKNTLQQEDHTL